MNLFISLKNYFSPNESMGEFLIKIDKGNNLWQIDDKISVINMNGYFYSSLLSFLSDINTLQSDKIEPHKILQDKITSDYFSPTFIDKDAELIKFAWESNSVTIARDLSFVKYAKAKISESKNIVIIGYTFPLYNRLVDLEYLSQDVIANRDVVVQDPNGKTITQNLLDYYRINGNNKLKPVVDCDSFYIPSSIFGVNEYQQPFSVSVL